ncbi:unnamed protein product, partial [Rotaria sp. Silwood2]
WFIIKDSYIVDKQPGIHEICFPMLIDHDFQVSTGIQHTQNCNEWIQHLLNLTEQVKDFVNETRNRFNSYAPIRET